MIVGRSLGIFLAHYECSLSFAVALNVDVDAPRLIVHQLDPFPDALGLTAGRACQYAAQRAHGIGIDRFHLARASLSLASDGAHSTLGQWDRDRGRDR